jgi:hypothetical protein
LGRALVEGRAQFGHVTGFGQPVEQQGSRLADRPPHHALGIDSQPSPIPVSKDVVVVQVTVQYD